jgi:protoporphyrinogen oxidase
VRNKVAVVGGGISGLSTAYFALHKGFDVSLYESSARLGGFAASFDMAGLTIEKYYHFICRGDQKLIELSNRLGINHKIKFQVSKTACFYNGHYYPFSTPLDLMKFSPISLSSRLKFGLNILSSKYIREWEKLDQISGKEWLCKHIGEEAYNAIWDPLLKIKFGNNYDMISAAWVWHRIFRVSTSRKTLLSREKMDYLEGGSNTLISAITRQIEQLGGSIHLNSKVQKITKTNHSFKLILESGRHTCSDRIVLAVPLPVTAEIIKDLDPGFSLKLSSIVFYGILCGVFRLKEKVSDAFWLNINDSRIVANGLIEYTNLNPLEEISPHKIVYIPFYVPVDNEWFLMDEASLQYRFLAMLKILKPSLSKNSVVDFRVSKSPYAQAICTIGFKDKVPPVTTPVKNLFLLDSTQIYPSDRTLSALIGLAEKMVDDNFN